MVAAASRAARESSHNDREGAEHRCRQHAEPTLRVGIVAIGVGDLKSAAGYGDSAERHADGKSDRKRDKYAAGIAQGNGRFELGRIELGNKPRE